MKHRIPILAVLIAFAVSNLAFSQAMPDTAKRTEAVKPANVGQVGKAANVAVTKPGMPGVKEETMVQRLNSASSLKTFAELIKTAELEKTLEGMSEVTVFAPNDAAFAKIPVEALNALKQDKVKLAGVLKNHLIAGKGIGRLQLAKLKGQKVKAESGMELNVTEEKGKWRIANAALTGLNMKTTNGPIHEIDTVIMPIAATNAATAKMPGIEKAPAKTEKKEEPK